MEEYISTHIRLESQQYDRLRDEAHETRKSQSNIVREALEKHWREVDRVKLEEIIKNAEAIEIVSGEGEQGTVEKYDGERTLSALIARLKNEECGGDRWAYSKIDGVRYDVRDDMLVPRY